MKKIVLLATAVMVAAICQVSPGLASDDHGGGKTIVVAPRVEARVGTRQFVLVYANRQLFEDRKFQLFGNVQRVKFDRPRLALFVEDFATAEPVTGAEIEATINFLPEAMSEIILGGGRNDAEIAYTIGEESGSVAMLLVVAGGESAGTAAAAAAVSAVRPVAVPTWIFIVGGLVVYVAVAGLFFLRRSRVEAPVRDVHG